MKHLYSILFAGLLAISQTSHGAAGAASSASEDDPNAVMAKIVAQHVALQRALLSGNELEGDDAAAEFGQIAGLLERNLVGIAMIKDEFTPLVARLTSAEDSLHTLAIVRRTLMTASELSSFTEVDEIAEMTGLLMRGHTRSVMQDVVWALFKTPKEDRLWIANMTAQLMTSSKDRGETAYQFISGLNVLGRTEGARTTEAILDDYDDSDEGRSRFALFTRRVEEISISTAVLETSESAAATE